MEFRRIFDTIPEKFDKWRPHYCDEAFDFLISEVGLDKSKSLLEIGPGTGQATLPLLETGCDYLAIELGENFSKVMRDKFSSRANFSLINADFETHDFGGRRFDVIFSAAAIQWIDEEIAFRKSYELLKNGGFLAMMLLRGDYRGSNEALYADIQRVYSEYFHPTQPYNIKFSYTNAVNYGFSEVLRYEFRGKREYTADDYVEYIGTHCDHMTLPEADKSVFFGGIRDAINAHSGKIEFNDTILLYLTKKA